MAANNLYPFFRVRSAIYSGVRTSMDHCPRRVRLGRRRNRLYGFPEKKEPLERSRFGPRTGRRTRFSRVRPRNVINRRLPGTFPPLAALSAAPDSQAPSRIQTQSIAVGSFREPPACRRFPATFHRRAKIAVSRYTFQGGSPPVLLELLVLLLYVGSVYAYTPTRRYAH